MDNSPTVSSTVRLAPSFLLRGAIGIVLFCSFAGSPARAEVLADLRGDFPSAASSGQTTASFNSAEGVSDQFGTGRWNYFSSSTATPALSGLPYLTFGNVGQGAEGFGGDGSFSTGVIGNEQIFNDGGTIESDELAMHPSNGSPEWVVARWTAGAGQAGPISIDGTFRRPGPSGAVDFVIYVDGVSKFTTSITSGSVPISFESSIAEGQHVDFVLGNGGGAFNGDESRLAITITSVPTTSSMVTIADVAADYSGPAAFPAGWEYLASTAASGGTEVALVADQIVGTISDENGVPYDHRGFGGDGTLNSAAVLGSTSCSSGNCFGLYNGFGHNGVQGVDLLLQPGNGAGDGTLIARYTVSAADVGVGTEATIRGSFRDLQGQTGGNGGNSIAVKVYHNTAELFSASGSAGRLQQAAGSFDISGVTIAAGDTISFVVGNNGHFGGDETAMQAVVEVSSATGMLSDDFYNVLPGSTTDFDVLTNDTGIGGLDLSSLTVSMAPAFGTAVVQGDGTIRYVHAGQIGCDAFEYSLDNLAGTETYTAQVDVLANNGLKTANATLQFPNEAPTGGWQFPNAFPGLTFDEGTCLEQIPGNSQALVVAERDGRVWLIPDVTATPPVKTLLLDISGQTRTQTFAGLRGVTFHPDFANNRYFLLGL